MASGYSLLPENFDLGLPIEPTLPVFPEISKSLTDFSDDISGRDALRELSPAPMSEPIKAPTALDTPPKTPIYPQSFMEKFGTKMNELSPVLARTGAELLKSVNSPFAGGADALANSLQSSRFSDAMRKATTDYLGPTPSTQPNSKYVAGMLGKETGPVGPTTQMRPSDTTGLTPEQIAIVNKTSMEARSKAVNEPIDLMLKSAQIHNTVAQGNYHQAQVPLVQAQLQKTLVELQMYVPKTLADMSEKNAQISKILADIQKVQAEVPKIGAETAKTTEETKGLPGAREKVQVETNKARKETQAIDWEKSPEFSKMRAEEKKLGMALDWRNAGNRWVGTDADGNPKAFISIGEPPGKGQDKAFDVGHQRLGAEYAASDMMPQIKAGILNYFKGDQKASAKAWDDLMLMMGSDETAAKAALFLRHYLNKEQIAMFDDLAQYHAQRTSGNTKAIPPATGGPATPPPEAGKKTIIGTMVDDIIASSHPTEEAAKKAIMEKYKVGDAVATAAVEAAKVKVRGKGSKPQSSVAPKEAGAASTEGQVSEPGYPDYGLRHREQLIESNKRKRPTSGLSIPGIFKTR